MSRPTGKAGAKQEASDEKPQAPAAEAQAQALAPGDAAAVAQPAAPAATEAAPEQPKTVWRFVLGKNAPSTIPLTQGKVAFRDPRDGFLNPGELPVELKAKGRLIETDDPRIAELLTTHPKYAGKFKEVGEYHKEMGAYHKAEIARLEALEKGDGTVPAARMPTLVPHGRVRTSATAAPVRFDSRPCDPTKITGLPNFQGSGGLAGNNAAIFDAATNRWKA